MCDEIGVCVEIVIGPASARYPAHDRQIIAEEFLEGPCGEAALQTGIVWGRDAIWRLCIDVAGETQDQASSRVDELTGWGVYRPRASCAPDGVKGMVRSDLEICLSYIEP